MRCRFCDTEIADKALICFRCGRATTDPKITPPVAPRGLSALTALILILLAVAAAIGLPTVADGGTLWAGWAVTAAIALAAAALWWGGRAGRR
jgi:hypothetical protein